MGFYVANKQNPGAKQRKFVLELLRQGPVTTNEFRSAGVLSPATRVKELRDSGFRIVTSKIWDQSHDGLQHRVGVYNLLEEAHNG